MDIETTAPEPQLRPIAVAPPSMSQTLLDLEISDTQGHMPGLDRGRIDGLVRRTLAREGVTSAELSIALVDDATIRAINSRHLAHHWETDVITFPLSGPGEVPLAGEIVVSTEMAVATANGVNADPWAELSLYLVHGLLHLVGYDDQTPEDAAAMRRREAFHLEAEGLTNTYSLVEGAGPGLQKEAAPWSD